MKDHFPTSYFSGLSGLQVPVPKYRFPPPYENASRLTYYSSLFNSLEVNSSFYKIPQPATVAKWAGSVNPGFKFTFKLWREITHCKGFNFKEEDVARFIETINNAGNKRGCLLIQLPPGIGSEHLIQLHALLGYIKKINIFNWRVAVEFRNRSWYGDSTYSLLSKFKTALVVHDMPKSATPSIDHNTDFVYVRFHGPTGNYRDSYSKDVLSEYATYITAWLEEKKEVYVYFNNTAGDAINNLKTMNDLVISSKANSNI